MNTNSVTSKKSRTKIYSSTLMRLAGISATVAGLCFIVVGMFHPVNVPASVTTATWVNVHIFAFAMCFFGLLGLVGLYARQAEESGWLGLTGFVLFSVWMGMAGGFLFVEAIILPRLTTESPAFVAGFLGMFTGIPSEVDLGILPTLWNLSGPLFIFGSLLFGIATYRAGVLPRWAGALLAVGAALIPVAALVPPELEPKVMIPIGLALAWMGFALFSERREPASDPCPDLISPQLSHTGAD